MKKLFYRRRDCWARDAQSPLIPRFLEEGWEVHYIGDGNGIEHEQVVKSGLDVHFHSIATGKLRRYFSFQNMLDVFKVGFGVLQSLTIIAKIRPQALFQKVGLYRFRQLLLLICCGFRSLSMNQT